MASGDSSGIHGSKWTYKLYFDSCPQDKFHDIKKIKHADLKTKLCSLVGSTCWSGRINKVYAYKTALSDKQLTKILLFHMLVVFKTDSAWWSIEKNRKGITLQRGSNNNEGSVKHIHLKEQRTDYKNIKLIEEDKTFGGRTIENLINFLYDKNVLDDKYDIYESNCKHFGKKIFDYLSMTKELSIPESTSDKSSCTID